MIQVEGLTKIFLDSKRGEVKAVDKASFNCERGEIFGLLGPNGAGKTTTLRLLSTILKPTAGQACVAGYDVVANPREVRQRIGFLSGNTGIYERMTPNETVIYFGRLYGMSLSEIRARRDQIFKLFEMEDFADTLNAKLSSGMRQKVSIARTLIHDPPVLIFDEPTVSLDILVARSVVDFIATCREQGKCVLLSTHIMSEAEKLCDKIAIIHQGRILVTGSQAELKESTGQSDLEGVFFHVINQQNGEKP